MPTYVFSDADMDIGHNGWNNTFIIHADSEKRARSLLQEKYDKYYESKKSYNEYIKDYPSFCLKVSTSEGPYNNIWERYQEEKGPMPMVDYLPPQENMKLIKILIDDSYFIAEAEE